MDTISEFLAALGGSARSAQLRCHFSGRQINSAIRSGEVARSGRGIYALSSLAQAEKLALEGRAVLFGRSAALAHGWSVLHRPSKVELAVPRGRRARRVPGTVVFTRLLPPRDLVASGALQATSAVRTVLDCAAMLPFAEGLAIADSALRTGAATHTDLEAGAATWVGRNRVAQARVLKHMDGRAANAFESGLRAACIEGGVLMEPQIVIRTEGGVHRVDLAKKIAKLTAKYLVAEADSFQWHGGRDDLHRDCIRYNELVRADCTVLRFSWEHVMHERPWISELVGDIDRRLKLHKSAPELRRSGPIAA